MPKNNELRINCYLHMALIELLAEMILKKEKTVAVKDFFFCFL